MLFMAIFAILTLAYPLTEQQQSRAILEPWPYRLLLLLYMIWFEVA